MIFSDTGNSLFLITLRPLLGVVDFILGEFLIRH